MRAATPSQLGEGFAELIERFLLSQDIKPTSKQAYRRALRPFFRWLTRERLRHGDQVASHPPAAERSRQLVFYTFIRYCL